MTPTILISIVLVIGFILFIVGLTHRARKIRQLRLGASHQALLLIGHEQPKQMQKHTGWRVKLHGYVVDVVYEPSAAVAYRIYLHKPMDSNAPIQIDQVAQAVTISPIDKAVMQVFILGQTYEGSLQEIISGWFPGAIEQFKALLQFTQEPVREFQIKEGWFTVSRDVLVGSLEQRNLSTQDTIKTYLIQLINQMAKFADEINFHDRTELMLLRNLFEGATPFESFRHKVLKEIMTKHEQSEQAEALWQNILREGNLYDALFLLNHNQQRFLRDISPARLLALVNGIQKSKRFETSALPQLLTQRFDFDVVLNTQLEWDVCQALLLLGMRDASNAHTLKIIKQLFEQSQESQQHTLMALAVQTNYGPMIDILVAQGINHPHGDLVQMLSTIEALAQEKVEHYNEPQTETFLLDLMAQDIHDVMCEAVMALGHVGLVRSMKHLRQMDDSSAWKLNKLSREVKRAIQNIEQRLRDMPNRGGITLSHTDQNQGALSISTQDGGLEIIDHDH